jgi:hypothetical protein
MASVHGPLWLRFAHSTNLDFDFDAVSDPAFHPNVQSYPASRNNADPNPDKQPCPIVNDRVSLKTPYTLHNNKIEGLTGGGKGVDRVVLIFIHCFYVSPQSSLSEG